MGGPTTLEFRTGPPNGKLARRALTDPALSPGSRVAKEYRYIPAPPAPAWDGPSGGIENGIAGYAFVGPSNMASSKKPRIPAEARQHRIGMMQVLSPQQRL